MTRTVLIHNDSLGIEAFRAIAAAVRAQTKDKILLSRLDRAEAVFEYRTNIAVRLLATPEWGVRREHEIRLTSFKAPEFFLRAAQAILDDVLEDNRAKDLLVAARRAERKPPRRYYF